MGKDSRSFKTFLCSNIFHILIIVYILYMVCQYLLENVELSCEVYCLIDGKWRVENQRIPGLDLASFYPSAEPPAAIFRDVLLQFELPRHGTEILVTPFAHNATDPPEAISEGFAQYAQQNPKLEFNEAVQLFMSDYGKKILNRPLKKCKLAFSRKTGSFIIK